MSHRTLALVALLGSLTCGSAEAVRFRPKLRFRGPKISLRPRRPSAPRPAAAPAGAPAAPGFASGAGVARAARDAPAPLGTGAPALRPGEELITIGGRRFAQSPPSPSGRVLLRPLDGPLRPPSSGTPAASAPRSPPPPPRPPRVAGRPPPAVHGPPRPPQRVVGPDGRAYLQYGPSPSGRVVLRPIDDAVAAAPPPGGVFGITGGP